MPQSGIFASPIFHSPIFGGPKAGGAAWNASDWGTVQFEWDFSDLATLFTDAARTTPVTADAQVIGGVTDKSGLGRHLSQANASLKPLYKANIKNGLSVSRYAGTGDNLFTGSFSMNQPYTLLAVIFATASGNSKDFLSGAGVYTNVIWRIQSSTVIPWYAGVGLNVTVDNTLNEWMALTGVQNSTASELWKNGTQYGSGNTGTNNITAGVRVAQANAGSYAGDIGHMVGYSGLLANRAGAEAALMSKWGIA